MLINNIKQFVGMNYFVEQALSEALKSPLDRKYGAVLIHRNRIISSGHNYYKKIGSNLSQCVLRP